MSAISTKIIIIDDEEDLCFLLSGLLKAQGYKVQTCSTLSAGLAAVESMAPNWVILDNDLPDGRGWDHTDEILESHPSAFIIKISANPDAVFSDDGGKIHHLVKPLHVNSIISLIEKHSTH